MLFCVLILSSVYLDDSMLESTISVSHPNPKSEVNFSCSSGSYSFPLCLSFFSLVFFLLQTSCRKTLQCCHYIYGIKNNMYTFGS